MKRPSLTDILAKKKKGDIFHTVKMPESYRYWSPDKPWEPNFPKLIEPICITVSNWITKKTVTTKYTKNEPWNMNCGTQVFFGQYYVKDTKSATLRMRVDSIANINESLEEASDTLEFSSSWEIKNITWINKKLNTELYFQLHNPNSTGTELCFVELEDDSGRRWYPEVTYFEQLRLMREFEEKTKVSKCELFEKKEIIPVCADEMASMRAAKKYKPKTRIHLEG